MQLCPKARQAIKALVQDHRYDYIETGSLISIKKNVKDILIPSEERKTLAITGLFVAIGQEPANSDFANVADLDDKGYVLATEDCKTKTPGVFTAGDCRTKTIRQLTTAASDGTIAALAATLYISQQGK